MERLDGYAGYRLPPRWATWPLERFCAPHLLEERRDNLEELYRARIETLGPKQPDYRYVRDVLSLIRPLVMRLNEQKPSGTILVRTHPGQTAEALVGLEKVHKALNPGFAFTCQFSDQEYDKLYRGERLVGQLFNGFAGLAIFISCLGLLGLAMFKAYQRVKEIAIRKQLGASAIQLVGLLCWDFLKLMGIAILLASPLAWYAVWVWLGQFAYRVDLEW